MRMLIAIGVTLTILAMTLACTRRDESPEDHARRVQEWRAQHEDTYRREWVTIAGLHFLTDGRYTAGSDPSADLILSPALPPTIGDFVVQESRVRFTPTADHQVHHNGEPLRAATDLRDTGDPPADTLSVGDVRIVVHRSGARVGLRVWDPDGPVARTFTGFRWFDIDPAYQVTGRFIPDAAPRPVQVMNTFGDTDTYTTEGVVEFTLGGDTFRMRPFTTRPNRFFFVFRDASSGEETYEAARFLYADLREDGTAVLDFNIAYNPPCAFNPWTTCPIPLRENILPVKVLAGERDYAGPMVPASPN